MKKLWLTVGLSAMMLGTVAPAALATVVDTLDLVPAADEAKLESNLQRMGAHQFEVDFVDHVTGTPSAAARQIFTQRRLGSADGVIVVAVDDKRVGVYLGKAFAQRGVNDTVISDHIKSDFLPQARSGQYARGASQLAQGLVQAGMTNGGRNRGSSGGGGFPWPLVIVVVVAGGGFWWWTNRSKTSGLKERLEALRASQERIVSGALKLAEVDTLARYKEGAVQRAYQTLGRESADVLTRSRTFGERFDEAESALKSGNADVAEKQIHWMERESVMLEPAVAASLTALDALETGKLSDTEAMHMAELPRRMADTARRLRDVTTAYANEAERGQQVGLATESRVAGALEDAQSYLTREPVDLDRANKAIDTAESGLERYSVAVSQAEERRAIEAQARAEQASANASNLANTAFIAGMLDGGHHHHDSNSGWNSSSSDSGWGGSSADESWGSGSDSSWDSGGGSSGDDNW